MQNHLKATKKGHKLVHTVSDVSNIAESREVNYYSNLDIDKLKISIALSSARWRIIKDHHNFRIKNVSASLERVSDLIALGNAMGIHHIFRCWKLLPSNSIN